MTTDLNPASPNPPAAPGFKQRAARELKNYAAVSAYLAILFCAVTTYTALLLRRYDESDTLTYTFALLNALVIGKVILLGEMLHLGRRVESRPLYQSVLLKSLLFALLVFLFHLLEEFIKRLVHGKPAGTVLEELELERLIARSIIIFCAFVPLFAFRELHRVLGEEKLHSIFFLARNP
ncbi:MAG: hypothetical protein PW789_10660 [Edaphobacter sp.]|uniref:hypothetical protein n=1 Tax=Edaphobacter sp. TaxID=1934404 RepID=UPI0023A1BDA1|nr:hypothetical protein [Edaphobacter sp.]MDE1177051.1 hypothetical protein [Edaphobacter sp.]